MSTLSEHTRRELEYNGQLDPGMPIPGCGCEQCTGMPKIYRPDTDVDMKFVRTVSIGTIAEYLGISLRRRGREDVGLCPFHDDNKPSLHVNADKNVYYCFACGAGGDSVDLYMGVRGCTFKEAVNQIRCL